MSENIDKDVELTEEELRQAAGGRRVSRADSLHSGTISDPARTPQDKLRRHDGDLDGEVNTNLNV